MSIKAMSHLPYTSHRDFVCLDEDVQKLPHNVSNGSTAITSDTGREFVYHRKENIWKQEKRPVPPFVWLGEYLSLESIRNPVYGASTSIRDEVGRRLYWFNGVKWVEIVAKEG